MKSHKLSVFLTIVIVLSNIFWICIFKTNKKITNQYIDLLSHYVSEYSGLKSNLMYSLSVWDKIPLSEISVTDTIMNDYQLSDVFYDDQYKLFCRMPQHSCSECVNYVASLSKLINTENIVYLIDKVQYRQMYKFMDRYDLHNKEVYMCEGIDIKVEESLFPYFFVLDRQGFVTDVYLPYEGNDELDSEMLIGLGRKYAQ